MDKVVSGGRVVEYETKFGRFNDPPPNMVEIDSGEFAKLLTGACIELIDYRQILPDRMPGEFTEKYGFKHFIGGRLFHTRHSEGIGVLNFFHPDENQKFVDMAIFFKFAVCVHDWEELSKAQAEAEGKAHYGMCYHVFKCKKCGDTMAYDSSD